MQGSARIDELRQKFHENPRRYFAPLANEYRKAGDPEQAIAICRAHLAQQPAHMSGHVVYAQALYDADRVDESRVVFEKALSLDPDNAIVLRRLGDISRQKGDSAEARHWYTRALDVDPHDREVAAYIAELTEPLTEPAPEAHDTEPLAAAETPAAVAAETEVEEVELAPVEEAVPAPVEATAAAPVGDIEPAPGEEAAPAPVDEAAPARVEEIELAPPEEIELAPAEETAVPLDVEVDIPASEEPPPLADMPGFEADEALFAADEDVELFPDSSSPFVTRTMADLYAKQGYKDQALEVYRKLAADNPHDNEIADRIRELSPADSAPPVEPQADTPEPASVESAEPSVELASEPPVEPASEPSAESAVSAGAAEPDHFTDGDLAGDEWDTSSWGAGFSSEETETISLDDEPVVNLDAEAPEPVVTDEDEISAPTVPLGVFNDAREDESYEEIYRPSDEPLSLETAFAPELAAETKAGEPQQSDQEAEHFVAYSPQPPEDDDLPHYTPAGPTIREFFATLGAWNPPANGAGASFTARAAVPDIDAETSPYEPADETAGVESRATESVQTQPADEFPLATDAFANLFPDTPVSEEDTRAAFALSGALSSQPAPPAARTYSTPQSPAPAIEATPPHASTQESEEDIRRFREWLDGLAES